MALTLAQYKAYTTPGISQLVVDEIQKEGPLLSLLPFTDNGADINGKWVYTYTRDEAQATADTRVVNEEYTPAEVVAPVQYTTSLAIMGGSYTIDRVMADVPSVGAMKTRQEQKLIQATVKKFNDLAINGNDSNAGEFDGLDVALTGSTTEYNPLVATDFSSLSAIGTNWEAWRYAFDVWLSSLDGRPDAFLVNARALPIITAIARKAGVYDSTMDNFGRKISSYDGIAFIDMGLKSGSSNPVIPVQTRTLTAGSTTNLTDIYAVRFGPDGFHGVSPNDKAKLIKAYEPDFERPGAVHLGEIEMVATVALEGTRAAGVFRNLKIA